MTATSAALDVLIVRHAGSPTTLTEYRAAHNRYIRPLVGRLPIAELDAGTLGVTKRTPGSYRAD